MKLKGKQEKDYLESEEDFDDHPMMIELQEINQKLDSLTSFVSTLQYLFFIAVGYVLIKDHQDIATGVFWIVVLVGLVIGFLVLLYKTVKRIKKQTWYPVLRRCSAVAHKWLMKLGEWASWGVWRSSWLTSWD